MLDVVHLVVQGGAFGLLAYLAVKGLPALLLVMSLYLKAQLHQDETIAKLTRAIIHLTYKIKNPSITNNEEMEALDKELTDHMQNLSEIDKGILLEALRIKKPEVTA